VYSNVDVDTGDVTGGNLFQLPTVLSVDRLHDRRSLLQQFDRMRAGLDQSGSMQALDVYQQQAVDMLLGERARNAFDVEREPQAVRDRYGKHLWCRQALIARRLVEAGTAFVALDLSYHSASGTWDTHGDNIPPYGGAEQLSRNQPTGGTFTASNLGMFGIDAFTPILNLPQAAILGIGRIVEEPVVRNGRLEVGPTLTLSLTFDLRVVNGALAARWLQRLHERIPAPENKQDCFVA